MRNEFIETGKIVGTHGVRGEMRVEPWCDTPADLTKYKALYLDSRGENKLKIKASRVHKNIVLITVDGISTIEEGEKYRGKKIYVSRKDLKLKKGDYLIVDLMGCEVFDAETGAKYGEISDVSRTGANDVWHISNGDKEYLIPAIPSVVGDVDVEKCVVTITPLKGIFDDED